MEQFQLLFLLVTNSLFQLFVDAHLQFVLLLLLTIYNLGEYILPSMVYETKLDIAAHKTISATILDMDTVLFMFLMCSYCREHSVGLLNRFAIIDYLKYFLR